LPFYQRNHAELPFLGALNDISSNLEELKRTEEPVFRIPYSDEEEGSSNGNTSQTNTAGRREI
jgi:hypothetical protein